MISTKQLSAEDAIAIVPTNATLAVAGFRWAGASELLLRTLGERHARTGTPTGLTLVFSSASGDNRETGLERLAQPDLLRRVIGGFWGATPRLSTLAQSGEIQAYNLPQGQIARLYGAIASGMPGLLSKVGLGTYLDPRHGGGRLNERTPPDLVEVVTLRNQEWLLYCSFPIDVAFIRGTTADRRGNISMEKEAVTTETLPLAFATHNSGGKVIAQVERIVDNGLIHPRSVSVPGHVVDAIVVAEDVANDHRQCVASAFDPRLNGDAGHRDDDQGAHTATASTALDLRKIIAHRAMETLQPGDVVNLGQGIPSEIANLIAKTPLAGKIHFTLESGVIGGNPLPVPDFGICVHPESIIRQDEQFGFYNGGGLDAAFLGFAEVDARGNVNVSKFGGRFMGCGGFLDITQATKKLVFCGSFLAGKQHEAKSVDGLLHISHHNKTRKFVASLQQLTFNAEQASGLGQEILFVTERCVFDLYRGRLRLLEVAPGIEIKRDILDHMEFRPILDDSPRQMRMGC